MTKANNIQFQKKKNVQLINKKEITGQKLSLENKT